MPETSGGINSVTTSYVNIVTTSSVTSHPQTVFSMITSITTPIQSSNTLNSNSTFVSSPSIHDLRGYEKPDHEEAGCSWQIITRNKRSSKRLRENDNSNTQAQQTTKKSNTNNAFDYRTANSSNIYTVLMDEEPIQGQNIPKEAENLDHNYKPPPIFIQDVVNYPVMLLSIETVIHPSEFICKTLSQNQIKINTKSADAYRKLIHLFKQNKIAFHTYQPREERAYRVVIKNLHYSIPTNDIKESLQDKGFEIRNVSNVRSWKTKEPLSIFFIDQEPNANNKEIYKLTNLLGTKITVEPPRKRTQIPQCMRCQEYGHTKSYCEKPFYCVKCAQNHATTQCQKTNNTPAKCILCDGPHPANYKGCPVYRELQKSRETPINQIKPKITSRYDDTTHIKSNNSVQNNVTYAQATNQSQNDTPSTEKDITLSQFLSKFETMINQLMNQTGIIINMLSTLLKNLYPNA